jgi:hypothetical protein
VYLSSSAVLKRKIRDKAAAKNVTIDDYSQHVTDVLRYTNVSDGNKFTEDYFTIIDSMKKKGYTLVEVKNSFTSNGPYRGVNTVVMSKGRYRFELQFHTPKSLAVKEKNHGLYEEQRLAATSAERKKALNDEMMSNAEMIPLPDGVDKIQNIRKDV